MSILNSLSVETFLYVSVANYLTAIPDRRTPIAPSLLQHGEVVLDVNAISLPLSWAHDSAMNCHSTCDSPASIWYQRVEGEEHGQSFLKSFVNPKYVLRHIFCCCAGDVT